MNHQDQEIEVKFYVPDLRALEDRLKSLGASVVQERVHETNLRYDTPGHELSTGKRVLRLRKDTKAVMTYKGPSQDRSDVNARQEIEFTVSDFGAAERLLGALGYQISVKYEKYRASYNLGDLEVTLDEMPYGNFAEIEGLNAEQIQAAAARLGLDWEKRITESYLAMFDRVKQARGMEAKDLTFENFKGVGVRPEELGVRG